MEVSFRAGSRHHFEQMDFESQHAVNNAIEMVRDARGFKTFRERFNNCQLEVTFGHNIYTTLIEIRPKSDACRGYAFYHEGHFYDGINRSIVELI